jgi:hypothetical protein
LEYVNLVAMETYSLTSIQNRYDTIHCVGGVQFLQQLVVYEKQIVSILASIHQHIFRKWALSPIRKLMLLVYRNATMILKEAFERGV